MSKETDQIEDVNPTGGDYVHEFESENGTMVTPEDIKDDGYLEARLAEISQEFGDSEPSQTAEAVTEEESGQEEEAPKDDKSKETEPEEKQVKSKSLARILAKEKQVREAKAKFEQEQAEFQEKLSQFEEAQRAASIDPLSYLKSLGVGDEQLQDLAKSVYYEALGDDAPEDYKGSRQVLQLRKEIESLKAELKGGKKETEQGVDPQVQQAYEQLVNGYSEAVYAVDESVPGVSAVVEKYGEDAVVQDILQVANEYAMHNPHDTPITAEEAIEYLNEVYSQKLGLVQQEAEPEQQAAKKTRPKTLRNNITNSSPKMEAPDPEKDWEAYKEYCRTRGMQAIEEAYKGGI